MKNEYHIKDKIDAYLLGKLAPEEATSFEVEIATDPYLAEQVKWQRVERQVMATLVEKDIRQDIGKWDAEIEHQNQTKRKSIVSKKLLFWFLLFIIAGLLIWQGYLAFFPKESSTKEPPIKQETPSTTSPASTQELNQKESVKEPSDSEVKKSDAPLTKKSNPRQPIAVNAYGEGLSFSNLRSIDEDNAPEVAIVKEAVTAYQRKQWSKAIQIIAPVTRKNQDNYDLQELLAHAYFRIEQYSKAAEIFQILANRNTPPYAERCQWYLTLALLAADNPQFEPSLEALLNDSEHDYHLQALELQSKLR